MALLMYYFVYQTKNMVNGKTYIGVHRTKRVNDGYIGCGIYRQSCAERILRKGANSSLAKAVSKYGYNNFEREILSFFDTYEEALEEEKWLVNKEWVSSSQNYNTSTGGLGRTDVAISKEHLNKLISIHSGDYVVCNIESGETFFVNNLVQWCEDNYPELVAKSRNGKKSHVFGGVLSGASRLAANKWWACRLSDWTGSPVVRNRKRSTYKCKEVHLIDDNGNVIESFDSATSAAKDLNLDISSVCKVCRGELDQLKNMRFRYAT